MTSPKPEYKDSDKTAKKAAKKDNDKTVGGGAANRRISTNQQKIGIVAGGFVIFLLVGISLLKNMDKAGPKAPDNGQKERLLDAANRNPGDSETFARLNGQVQSQAGQLDGLATKLQESNETNQALLAEMKLMREEMTAKDHIYGDVNKLQKELEGLKNKKTLPIVRPESEQGGSSEPVDTRTSTSPPVRGGARSLIAPRTSTNNSSTRSASGPSQLNRRVQTVISLKTAGEFSAVERFNEELKEDLANAKEPEVYNTENYVPPNAHAPATVYVGVDAGTGSTAQADPQVAAFIITGAAEHVEIDGITQKTDLEGCIVNGAATGDLSTERVFIKLQKMTCPLEGGRVAVSEVEGHVTQKGKAGVRGTVVSREGDLLTKAMIAGLAQGIGQGASSFGQGGIGIGSGGGLTTNNPDVKEIGIAALGSGVAQTGQSVSEYVLERAKAYDPVVQMPTGIEVELVFISGTLLRPSDKKESK